MSNQIVSVNVPKEFNDVVHALVNVVLSIKAGKVDLAEEMAILIPVVGELSVAFQEIKDSPIDCARAGVLAGLDLASALLS